MLPFFPHSCLCLTEQDIIKLWDRNGRFLLQIECCPLQRTLASPLMWEPYYLLHSIQYKNEQYISFSLKSRVGRTAYH